MTSLSPLAGLRILVTRPRAQADGLLASLAALGAQPIALPTIEIAPLVDPTRLDQAIACLEAYDWIIFTSVNGVTAFWQRLELAGAHPEMLMAQDQGGAQKLVDLLRPAQDDRLVSEQRMNRIAVAVAAIGPATARALEERGITPRFVPSEYIAEAIASGIGDIDGKRILLPRAEAARETLAVELRRQGAVVDEIAAYRTVPAAPDVQALDELRQGVDAILFTSSSTVRNYMQLIGHSESTGRAAIACIGPITAQTVCELGLTVDIVAGEYTTDGLVRALVSHFQHTNQSQEQTL